MNRFHKFVLLWICFSIQYANAQAFTFDLKAYTSQSNSADTPGEISVSFLVNGVWTQTEPFFTGANKGDLKTKSFTTSNRPTKLKFHSNSNVNAWGYWKVVFANSTILLDPNEKPDPPLVRYRIADGDSSETPPPRTQPCGDLHLHQCEQQAARVPSKVTLILLIKEPISKTR